MVPLDDVVERASERRLDDWGRVQTVHGPVATRLTNVGSALGTLPRFRPG
jgi:hypothetical protein